MRMLLSNAEPNVFEEEGDVINCELIFATRALERVRKVQDDNVCRLSLSVRGRTMVQFPAYAASDFRMLAA